MIKFTPYGSGARYQDNELAYLRAALERNTLFYAFPQSAAVARACEMMRAYTGRAHVVACSSGSAAVHLGLIAAGIGPGDEVILTPNTDSGSALGILAEGAVPVFCDCDENLQPTAAGVAAQISRHTKAVIVVHLAGFPAPVDEILAVCAPRGIAVVEDCAQAWGARLHGRPVGSFGVAGCFSLNEFKHISTGDGGFVALDDAELYRRVANYADKHYDRLFGGEQRQAHHGLNYRMTELQGAVACAQLEKVERITARHHALGAQLREQLSGLRGARLLTPRPGGYSTDWWQALFLDPALVTINRDAAVAALQAEGLRVNSYSRYDLIQTGLFQSRVVRPWLTDERRYYPFVQPDGRTYYYDSATTPVHRRCLATGIQIPLSQFYTDADIAETAAGIRKVLGDCGR
jgi:dTDP-4-amino-4,6-dideoxygalactose transaminase